MARAWYSYNGFGDPLLISSYNLSSTKPTCINGPRICAIYEFNGGVSPSTLSANIKTYIANIGAVPIAQPAGPVGAKKYVYSKPC